MVDCVDADLTGEALDEAVEKGLFCWLQVRDKMGRFLRCSVLMSYHTYQVHSRMCPYAVAGRVGDEDR